MAQSYDPYSYFKLDPSGARKDLETLEDPGRPKYIDRFPYF